MNLKNYIVAILCLIMCFSMLGCTKSEKMGYFENTRWGMTLAEVNNISSRVLLAGENGGAYCTDVGIVEGLELEEIKVTSITYSFSTDGGLAQVVLLIDPAPKHTAKDVNKALVAHLNKLYDRPEQKSNAYYWHTETGEISLITLSSSNMLSFSGS